MTAHSADDAGASSLPHPSADASAISTRLLERVADMLPGVIYAFRRNANGEFSIPYANASLEQLFGTTPGALRHSAGAIFDHIHPDDVPHCIASIDASARTLSRWESQFRVLHPSRGERWFLGQSMPEATADGAIVWYGFVADITEQHRLETAIREREAMLSAIIDNSPSVLTVKDFDGRYVLANPNAQRLLGLDEAAIVGKTAFDLLDEAAARAVTANDRRVIESNARSTFQERVVFDGVESLYDSFKFPICDSSGTPSRICSISLDVTQREKNAATLAASLERLEALGSATFEGIAVTRDGVVVDANEQLCTLLRRPRSEVIGTHVSAFLADESRHDFARSPNPTGEDLATDVTLQRPDGSTVTVETRTRSMSHSGVNLRISALRDVSERRRTEASAREISARFRQVVETIREAFWLTDVTKQTILYISPAYETIWGRSTESLMSSPESWIESIHADDRDRVRAAAMQQQVNGTYDEEYRIVRPDGTERWIHDVAYPVREADGSVLRVVGVAEDVTERRSLEATLRQAQKMESIGQLAGGVAHDFNNALTVILGCTQLLSHDVAVPEPARELLGEISLAGERAASLTRQLLAFSRQEVLSPKLINLDSSIMDTRRMLERLLGEDIRIMMHLDGALPSIKVDPGHVAQVLMNLSVNARDAMPHGGTLEFSTRVIRHDADFVRGHPGSREGDFVELSVRDSGSGMPPRVLARVFEPFFTTKEMGRGTGLGLAVVHGIVSQNGGTIDVESQEGIGTVFRIAFPAERALPSDAAVAPGAATTSRRERILLVEDDDAVRRLALRALESSNYRVIAASNGVEALELLARHGGTIDALVTDVVMPGMSGSDLAHGVRSICPTARILLTSGYTNDALSRNGVQQDELHFLPKPYSVGALLHAVRELLDAP